MILAHFDLTTEKAVCKPNDFQTAFICKFKQLVLMCATVCAVIMLHFGFRCGFHFQLDSLRFRVFEFQGYRHFFAFFQLFFRPMNITW